VSEDAFPDHWGILAGITEELGAMVPLLNDCQKHPEAVRGFVRWFFASLDTVTIALKAIALERAMRNGLQLSQREAQVLQVVQEPFFAGQGPPRRIEEPMREGLTVALNIYAKSRNVESPLVNGVLPPAFINASVVCHRLWRPQRRLDLNLTAEDFRAIAGVVSWFRDLHQWLSVQRRAEIDEMQEAANRSNAELRRRIQQDHDVD
jgi:hypothetical protein